MSSLDSAGGIGGLLACLDTQGTTTGQSPEADDDSFAFFYDANGNVGQLVNISDGSLGARYEYDAYGNLLLDPADPNASGPYADENKIRFSTKYWDDETGLGYWGYRYYDPWRGRWTSRDPIGEAGGFEIYRSVENAPIGAIDPHGHLSLIGDDDAGTDGDEAKEFCRDLCLPPRGDLTLYLPCVAGCNAAGGAKPNRGFSCAAFCTKPFESGPRWDTCMAGCIKAGGMPPPPEKKFRVPPLVMVCAPLAAVDGPLPIGDCVVLGAVVCCIVSGEPVAEEKPSRDVTCVYQRVIGPDEVSTLTITVQYPACNPGYLCCLEAHPGGDFTIVRVIDSAESSS